MSVSEDERPVDDHLRRRAVRDSLNLALAVGSYGAAYGAAAVAAGFSPLQASLFSLFTFTGGSQFAIAGVVAGGGTMLAALASGWLLGARNTLYAVRMRPIVAAHGVRRLVAAHLTIDESTAMSLSQTETSLRRLAFWVTGAGVFVFWNGATLLGAFGAKALGDPARLGLDAAVPAAFLGLLAPWLRSAGLLQRSIALIAALVAAALIPLAPPGVPVLASVAALGVVAIPRVSAGRGEGEPS